MQYQRQRNFAQKGQQQNQNGMAPIYNRQNSNNSLSIHDSREFQFLDYEQGQMQFNGFQKDINRTSFVQSPINKIKSELTINQNNNPHGKDNQQDMQFRELTNILNHQQNTIKPYNISSNNCSPNKLKNKFKPEQLFWPNTENQFTLEPKFKQTNLKNLPRKETAINYQQDFELKNNYKILKVDYERLQSQYRKVKGQNQNLRSQKSNLMNENIQNTKKINHNYQQKMAELSQTIQQLEAKVYRLQMGDIVNNSKSFSGIPNSQTGRNSTRQRHQNGAVLVNQFYLQELQKNNEHLKRQNTRLNEVLMQKMRNSFKNMY